MVKGGTSLFTMAEKGYLTFYNGWKAGVPHFSQWLKSRGTSLFTGWKGGTSPFTLAEKGVPHFLQWLKRGDLTFHKSWKGGTSLCIMVLANIRYPRVSPVNILCVLTGYLNLYNIYKSVLTSLLYRSIVCLVGCLLILC